MANKNNRSSRLAIRLTPEEFHTLQELSSDYNNASSYIRAKIFFQSEVTTNPKELLKSIDLLYLELKRIGNNVNQIAKRLNENPNVLSDDIVKAFNEELSQYTKSTKKLSSSISKIIK